MSKNHADRSQSGFTLIEVTVALAVAALGLGVLMASVGMGLGQAKLADQYIEATRRVQSHLAEIGAADELRPGTRSGDDGGGYAWQAWISEPLRHAGAGKESGSDEIGLYTIDVTVTWRSGFGERRVSLRSQRARHVVNTNE